MTIKCSAIIFRILKYSDLYNILDVYTREKGRMSILVKHSSSKKNGYRGIVFRPLSLVALEIAPPKTSGLSKLIAAENIFPFHQLNIDVYKSSIGLFLCECLYHAVREETENQPLFEYLVASLKWFEQAERKQTVNFHILFLLRLTRFIGIYPNLERYKEGAWFDLIESHYTLQRPWHKSYLTPTEATYLQLLSRMNYGNLHLFKLNRTHRIKILELLILYYRIHIEGFPIPQSFSILQEIFKVKE